MTEPIRSAQRCVVGPGVMAEIGEHAVQFGRRALVIGGQRAIAAVQPDLVAGLDGQGIAWHLEQGTHVQKTRASVTHLAQAGRAHRAALVIACGGGAVMDCAKAVAHELHVPLINVPTTAATNACGTAGASIEGDDVPRRTWYQGADVILADTAVIARAGARSLASGMGDALPSWFGAQVALRRGQTRFPATRLAMARLCTSLILEHGAESWHACGRGESVPAVEQVVEAIVYCSGVAGFGMPGDHNLHPARLAAGPAAPIHGEWVAFGFLVRVVLGGEFVEELPALLAFLRSVNLPTRFADFGLPPLSREALLSEARRIIAPADTADYHTGYPVTPEAVCDAMLEVDRLGRAS
jgi:glycerol dehydrogenase